MNGLEEISTKSKQVGPKHKQTLKLFDLFSIMFFAVLSMFFWPETRLTGKGWMSPLGNRNINHRTALQIVANREPVLPHGRVFQARDSRRDSIIESCNIRWQFLWFLVFHEWFPTKSWFAMISCFLTVYGLIRDTSTSIWVDEHVVTDVSDLWVSRWYIKTIFCHHKLAARRVIKLIWVQQIDEAIYECSRNTVGLCKLLKNAGWRHKIQDYCLQLVICVISEILQQLKKSRALSKSRMNLG